MTKRERVINTFLHKCSDFVPFHADFTMEEAEKIESNSKLLSNVHMHYFQYIGWPTELPDKSDFFIDDFGVIWNRSGVDKDIGVIESPIISEPDISLWKEPILNEKRLRNEFENLLATKQDKFTFAGIGFSMFERAWSLCGMEELLVYMITDPDFVDSLLDKICDYNLKIMDLALEYPFDGFYFGDDWGQQKGLIMGPALWRKFIKPRMAKMYSKANEKGLFVIQHSCGDIEEIFEDLIEIGLSCYQTFQTEIYDIEKVKEKYGDSLSFWGGISTQQLLPYATPEKVREETIKIIKIMSKNGGFIVAPTHAVTHDIPIENITAMFEVFENQEKYIK